MNHHFRQLAPITAEAWTQIEDEATRSLRHFLAGRKVVDISGPHGWEYSAFPLNRVTALADAPCEGTQASLRQVLPLIEVRTPFTLSISELANADRGAEDLDLEAVVDAARRAAAAEDRAIFHGYEAGGVHGLAEVSPHAAVEISDDYANYPTHVEAAVGELRAAGVDGPYHLALGPQCYTGVIETDRAGHPIFEHLRLVLDGGRIIWAPAVKGAVVISARGGDAEIAIGQDFSIGYSGIDGDDVRLYLEESFTFRVTGPEAAVALVYP